MFRHILSSPVTKRFYSAKKGRIEKITARQVFDSRGFPTVEATVITDKGTFRAKVPSGSSTGKHEAFELRDGGKDYLGKGVLKAVNNIMCKIGPGIIQKGFKATQQCEIDHFMKDLDGSENKKNLGGNAILAVSIAIAKAGARSEGVPVYKYIATMVENCTMILPVPSFNVINGGVHAGNGLSFQEFMILPIGACTFTEAMKMGTEVYQHLKKIIEKKYGLIGTAVGYEGGFVPNIKDNREALELVKEAIDKACYQDKVFIGLDVAASEFYKDEKYDLDYKNPENAGKNWKSVDEMIEIYRPLICDFGIVSVEDPFEQDHFPAWQKFMCTFHKTQVVGDDLIVTNPKRMQRADRDKACNCLLLKVNQIGTLTESMEAHKLARTFKWGTMVSHRSGDTEDAFIADLAVGLSSGQIKAGAPCRSSRVAKYNKLLLIEEEMGDKAIYAGKSYRTPWKIKD